VADRYYPLKVERENEEKIRKAARMINEKSCNTNSVMLTRCTGFSGNGFTAICDKLNEEEEKLNSNHFPDAIKELINKIDSVLEEKSNSVL